MGYSHCGRPIAVNIRDKDCQRGTSWVFRNVTPPPVCRFSMAHSWYKVQTSGLAVEISVRVATTGGTAVRFCLKKGAKCTGRLPSGATMTVPRDSYGVHSRSARFVKVPSSQRKSWSLADANGAVITKRMISMSGIMVDTPCAITRTISQH